MVLVCLKVGCRWLCTGHSLIHHSVLLILELCNYFSKPFCSVAHCAAFRLFVSQMCFYFISFYPFMMVSVSQSL